MEMTQLYRKEKFNPAAGCLPLLHSCRFLLCFGLLEKLGQGASFLWIPDLAESDPFHYPIYGVNDVWFTKNDAKTTTDEECKHK